jgi:hypothetical protein
MGFGEIDPYEEVFSHAETGTLNTTILPDHGGPTIRHSTYKTGMIIIVVILFILASVAIVLAVQYSSRTFVVTLNPAVDRKAPNLKKISPGFITDRFTVESHPGAISQQMVDDYQNGYRRTDDGNQLLDESDCHNSGGHFNKGKCTCPPFKWGEKCERESYPTNYLMANIDSISNLSIKDTFHTDSLYGTGVACTDLCNEDKDCLGVQWERQNNICRILSQAPDAFDLTFDPSVDGNVFVRTDRGVGRPVVTKNVVLFNGNIKTRFWLDQINSTDQYNIITLLPDRTYRMTFYPSGSYNDGSIPLIYSAKNFTIRDAKIAYQSALNENDLGDFYVHIPGKNSFKPPLTMTMDAYYVMALHNSQPDLIAPQKVEKSGTFKLISGSRSITRSIRSPSDLPMQLEFESSIDDTMSYEQSASGKMVSSNWST